MKCKNFHSRVFSISLLVVVAVSLVSGSFVLNGNAAPISAYYFKFTVDREGFTSVAINFNSTLAQGDSWVFVPKFSSWNNNTERGQITSYSLVDTDAVGVAKQYFYQAFKFHYQSVGGLFNMTVRFGFNNGALIIEPRGIFYSPLIGFQLNPATVGNAEVSLVSSFRINSNLALAIGNNANYNPTKVQTNRVLFNLLENQIRLQVEFSVSSTTPSYTILKSSDNKTFTFQSVTRYQNYSREVLKLYDQIYSNFTRLFNTTLDSVTVQWFLPDFQTLLTVGGFVPFTGGQLGEININVAFIRSVNGTVEVIAAHELVHRFIGKTGISPSNFLWFHEGMAQYISVTATVNLGYEGAMQERDNLENGATALVQTLGDDDFSPLQLQKWSPSNQPSNVDVGSLYVASYYVVSRLPQVVQTKGLDYYSGFFKLIQGVKIDKIDVLALYFSTAANASVALTLQRWGFTVADLYNSPVSELIKDVGRGVEAVNPVFQPYRSLAEYFYQQALLSAERGDWERAKSFLELAMTMANLAPLLTFLTIVVILAVLAYVLNRLSKRPKPTVPTVPTVPPPPPEIQQPAA